MIHLNKTAFLLLSVSFFFLTGGCSKKKKEDPFAFLSEVGSSSEETFDYGQDEEMPSRLTLPPPPNSTLPENANYIPATKRLDGPATPDLPETHKPWRFDEGPPPSATRAVR